MNRYFTKCLDCLNVAALDSLNFPHGLRCQCGGFVENMGKVWKARLVHDIKDCPCDGRCTNAVGPSCDCRGCGGENHGSHKLVDVLLDAGGIPRINGLLPEESRLRAEEYRAAMGRVKAIVGPYDYRLAKVRDMRLHNNRMARLALLEAKYGKKAA